MYQCEYPGCNRGKQVGKKHCPRHVATPFFDKCEVNAYRRGLRDAKPKEHEVVLSLDEADALIAAVCGNSFDTKLVDTAMSKVNASHAQRRTSPKSGGE